MENPATVAPHLSSEYFPGRDAEDVVLLTVIRCIGLLYGYYQVRLLCNLGSKYTLVVTSLFPIVASMVFNSLDYLLPAEFHDIPETLVYFLLILDLPRACFLAGIAIQNSESSTGKSCTGILQGVKILAPWLSMDTVIEFVVVLLGYYSGNRRLKALCTFVCLAVFINYVALLTIYPFVLKLVMKLFGSKKPSDGLECDSTEKRDSRPPNLSRLDALLQSWEIMSTTTRSNLPTGICELIQPSGLWLRCKIVAAVVFALAYVFGWISISVDQLVVLSVAAALTIRYLFFEEKPESLRTLCESTVTTTTTNTVYLDSGFTSSSATCGGQALNTTSPAIPASDPGETQVPSTPSPVPTQKRVRKMPVNIDEVERLLRRGDLIEGNNNNNNNSKICSDSRVSSKSALSSGAETPITFSIGDHSESDDEADSEDSGVKDDQMEESVTSISPVAEERWSGPPRSLEQCLALYRTDDGVKRLSDEEIINLVNAKHIPAYMLEKAVQDLERGVVIRRKLSNMQKDVQGPNGDIPYKNYDYSLVQGACCENVIGYIPVPVGIAGPLKMDGQLYYVPMATTEGCLVASTNRGCRAFTGGVRSRVVNDGMSRAPVVRFPTAIRAAEAMLWLGETANFEEIKQGFDSSSRFARLVKIHPRIAGRYLFIRFVAKTGDAMGMNMISKGTELALQAMQNHFPEMEVLALSGNLCTDKKPAAVNWLEGRGKSVVAEAIVPANVVENVLKTTTAALVELNIAKNLVGSAAAGSIGGFNAHAANIVTAIYIACGQDPAQNVASSNCMTIMEPSGPDGRDLFISCTMPSIECGTVGGGTILPPQAACLEMLGVRGANASNPGENARTFARIVSAAVLAGELSLMSALAAGHLVRSHLKHNRSATLLTAIPAEPQKPSPSPDQDAKTVPATAVPKPPSALNGAGELIKRALNSKSTPVISTMEFLSVPECKQT